MQSIQEIKSYIKQNGITYQQLSDKSGIPLNTLKNLFRGKTINPRIDTMQAIERALELNTPSIQFTDEEKAAGVGAHGTNLSAEEWDWLELRSEIIRTKGEKGLKAITSIIKTYTQEK